MQPMAVSPPLFSRQRDEDDLGSRQAALLSAAKGIITCVVKIVRGTLIQDSKGHFTPAPGYEPPVDVHTIFGNTAHAEGRVEAAKSIFSSVSTNKALSDYEGLFGGAGTSGRLFGDKPPSFLFGPPPPPSAPEITFKSLFGGRGVSVATDDCSPFNPTLGSLQPGSEDKESPFSLPGGVSIFGSRPFQGPWPSNMSRPPNTNIFGGPTTGLPNVGADGNGNPLRAVPDRGTIVGIGESGKVGGFGIHSVAGTGSSFGFGGANVGVEGETQFQRGLREHDARKAAEQQRTF
jgi:hypothetical protein